MQQRTSRALLKWLSALLGGVAAGVAFPPVNWWPLAILGFALLVALTAQATPKQAAAYAGTWALAFFLPHLYWANFAVGWAPWVLLSVSQALVPAVVFAVWRAVSLVAEGPPAGSLPAGSPSAERPSADSPPPRAGAAVLARVRAFVTGPVGWPIVLAALWTAGEGLRSIAPFGGFPWGRLAFSQADSPIGNLAWLGGMPLVSFTVALAGAYLAAAALKLVSRAVPNHEQAPTRNAAAAPYPAIIAPVIAAIALTGIGLAVPLDTAAQAGTLRVGAVQGNVPGQGLDAFSERRVVLNNHLAGTYDLAEAATDLDLVVWPENGTDIDPMADPQTYRDIDDAAAAVGAPILVGTVQRGPGDGRSNASLLWQAGTGPIDRYVKQRPAPFAEYIPLRPIARLVSDAVDLVKTDMVAGQGVGTVTLPSERLGRAVVIGDVICFEVAYDGLVRESAAAGAELLVVQTNNATFGYTAESVQQLAMSRLRAIETGRAVVHISTVGVSAMIAPDGAVIDIGGHFVPEIFYNELPLRSSITPAVILGPWVSNAFLAIGALGLLIAVGRLRIVQAFRTKHLSAAVRDNRAMEQALP